MGNGSLSTSIVSTIMLYFHPISTFDNIYLTLPCQLRLPLTPRTHLCNLSLRQHRIALLPRLPRLVHRHNPLYKLDRSSDPSLPRQYHPHQITHQILFLSCSLSTYFLRLSTTLSKVFVGTVSPLSRYSVLSWRWTGKPYQSLSNQSMKD